MWYARRWRLPLSRPQQRPMAQVPLEGTGVVRRSYCSKMDERKPFSHDLEASKPIEAIFNLMSKFMPFAKTSPKASIMVYQAGQKLLRLEAEWRQKAELQAVGFTRRSVAAMLVQAISTAQARLKVAEAVASAAAAAQAATQPGLHRGKSCIGIGKFLYNRQAQAAYAGPTAYGVLVGNPMSLFGARAGIHSGQFNGYTAPKPAAQHSNETPACTGNSSPAGVVADTVSSPRAGGKGQEAAVVTALVAAEGKARAGKRVIKARISGGRRSTGSVGSISGSGSINIDYLKAPKAFRTLQHCATTRGAPRPADAPQTGTLLETEWALLINNSTAAGKRAARVSGMLSAPATPRGSCSGGRPTSGSRVSISSLDSGSADCKSLLRSSSWGSNSLGAHSALERSSSCGSLPGASLQLLQLPVLPATSGNMSVGDDKDSNGTYGMSRVCVLVMALVLLLVLIAFAMQQYLASICSSDVSSGSSGTTTAVFF